MTSTFGKIPGLGQMLRGKPPVAPTTESPPVNRKSPVPALPIAKANSPVNTSVSPRVQGTPRKDEPNAQMEGSAELLPPVNSESTAFLLPEDQVSVEILQRLPENDIKEYVYKPSPLYISSSYDSYSRNYCSINIGKNLPQSVALVKFGSENQPSLMDKSSTADMLEEYFTPQNSGLSTDAPSEPATPLVEGADRNILQPYCPALSEWYSTFRSVPEDTAHLLSGRVVSDSNILLKFLKLQAKQKPFEPLFGSAAFYVIIDDEIHRITETFHFDGAQESLRRYYGTCYLDSEGVEIHPNAAKNYNFTGHCVNVADASGDATHLHMCNALIPEELRYRDIFLVVQLSKIMSGDSDRAPQPYYPRQPTPEFAKHKESCERLSRYRQPVGIGIVKINDESGRLLGSASMGEFSVPFYAQKVVLSDQQIQQTIRELFPADGTNVYLRFETLDVDLRVAAFDLGRDDQMIDKLLLHEKGFSKLVDVATAGNPMHAQTRTHAQYEKHFAPILLPAQIQSESAQLSYANYKSSLSMYSKAHAALSVRHLLPLLPAYLPRSPMDFTQVTRQAKSSVDNTLFVYPIMLDRFKNRNLSVKVQLVEFKSEVPLGQLFSCPHDVLCSVYNTQYITGPAFVSEAYSRVSYHTKNPAVNDEFKIRLPDVLGPHHWLKFTVMHVHVKPTAQRSSLLGNMMRSSVEVLDKTSMEVGVGFLPLMMNGDAIIEDAEHQVKVYGVEEGPAGGLSEKPSMHNMSNTSSLSEGLIRVRTRAFVSLVSQDKRVQAALKFQPIPLGKFPTSIMSGEVAARIMKAAQMSAVDELKILSATKDLTKATPLAISRHFFVLMSQLMRTLTAGTGVMNEVFSNPYKHDMLRCQAFLTLLQLLGKVASDAGTPSSTGLVTPEKLFLQAYVDYVLDEEQPLHLDDLVKAGCLNDEQAEEIATALVESTTTAAVNAAAAAVTATTPMKGATTSIRSSTGLGCAEPAVTSNIERSPAAMLKERMKAIGVDVSFGPEATANPLASLTPPSNVDTAEDDKERADQANLNIDNIDIELDMTMRNTDDGDIPGMSADDLYASDMDCGSGSTSVGNRVRLSSAQSAQEEFQTISAREAARRTLISSASETMETYPGVSAEDFDAQPGDDNDSRGSQCSSEDNEENNNSNSDRDATSPALPKGPAKSSPPSAAMLDTSAGTGDSSPSVGPNSATYAPDKNFNDAGAEEDMYAGREEDELYEMQQDAAAALAAMTEPESHLTGDDASPEANGADGDGEQDSPGTPLSPSAPCPLSQSTLSMNLSNRTLPSPGTNGFSSALATHGSMQGSSERDGTMRSTRYGADRQSWGRFITDSMWSSAKLDAVAIAGTTSVTNSELSASISSKYLDDIATHLALQAEKLVMEELLGLAVQMIAAEVPYGDGKDRRPKSFSRAQAQALADGMPTENQILAGKRFRLSKRVSTKTPFEEERTWFAAVDEGRLVDDFDVSIRNHSNTDVNSTAMAVLHQRQMEAQQEKEVCIEPILPVFDPIEGYKARSKKMKAGDQAAALAAAYQHWWPWLYEVLVFQWGAILTISLSAVKLISGSNTQSMVGSYPYEADIREQSAAKGPLKADSIRSLLAEHCPMLLRMIYKSLALRIAREGLRAPVVLDVQFMGAIENLVMLLAVEAASFSSGLWRSRKMVSSLAGFLRSLFALVSPNQVIRLIRSYFRASRRNSRVEEAEMRLQMVEELGWFDHLVAVNFPYTLDAPLQSFAFECIQPAVAPSFCTYSASAYTAVGIRGITNPSPYALAHIIIAEIMVSYRQEERKVKDAALEVMRDLLVRHAYDARYQSKISQQRVACMYLPLLQELLNEHNRIGSLKHDSTERKDVLAIFMYLFQGMPDRVMRHFVRTLCGDESEPSSAHTTTPNSRILSLKTDKSLTNPSTKAYIPPNLHKKMKVYNLLLMLHLILDTFELPKILADKPLAAAASVFGGGATAAVVATTAYSQLLAPGVQLEGAAESLPPNSLNLRRTSTESGGPPSTAKAGVATSLYKNLDQRLQTKKTASVASKRTTGGKSEQRNWVNHVNKMAAADQNEVRNDKYIIKMAIGKQTQMEAAQVLCESATRTVISMLLVLFDVCPPELSAHTSADPGGVAHEYAFILRDSNIDEALLVGISNLQVVYFMRKALSVILHGLYCNQTDELLCLLINAASTAVRNFGAKVFLVAVEDSLQDWMRASLFHCASHNTVLSNTSSNFLLYILRACFHYLGSATLITNTILAVINDVLESVLDNNQHLIKTYADEDDVLSGLEGAIRKMKAAAKASAATYTGVSAGSYDEGDTGQQSFGSAMPVPNLGSAATAAYCKTVVTLMENLEIIMQANSDLRRHASHPVGFDFYGSNMLDGPWDERNSSLMSSIRNKRRSVQPDPASARQGTLSGFHLEEVMVRLHRAAEVYDPFKLPRFRMYWLENLAMLHKRNMNRAEGAEVRWKIYKLCELVEDTWKHQWVPRPPLPWSRRVGQRIESTTGPNSAATAGSSGLNSAGKNNNMSMVASHLSITKQDSNLSELDTDKDRNFYKVLKAALDARPNRSWTDYGQYLTHIQTSLDEATKGYNVVNLIHLAERTSFRLVHLYRLLKKPERMLAEYTKMAEAVKAVAEKGVTSSMAIGTFYRVYYDGLGVPSHLRGKEFIFRNGNHVHVKEFQDQVISHLKSIVEDGVSVSVVQNISADHSLDDHRTAYIIMNSVKLMMNKSSELSVRSMDNVTASGNKSRPVSFPLVEKMAVEGANQVKVFHYNVPFTQKGKNHAKSIDEQWMRSTILTVKEPFPYIMTRQLVQSREIRVYSPIEVAVYDIEERIEAMEAELEKVVRNPSDCNNLMRIVQGTVMPQVNAGVGEVAKVFLNPARTNITSAATTPASTKEGLFAASASMPTIAVGGTAVGLETLPSPTLAAALRGSPVFDTTAVGIATIGEDCSPAISTPATVNLDALKQEKIQQELVLKLKMTLIDFLTCSKLLLQKARSALIDGQRSSSSDSASSNSGISANASTNNLSGNVTTRGSISSVSLAPNAGNRSSLGGSLGGASAVASSAAATLLGSSSTADAAAADALAREQQQFLTWQTEMERSFEGLLQSIMPYLSDLADSDLLINLK